MMNQENLNPQEQVGTAVGTQAGVGMSHHRNPKRAAKEATEAALGQAGIEHPDFVFLFASIAYNQQVLVKTVRELTKQAPLAGCTGEGIVSNGEADESNFSVAVMALKSDRLRFEAAIADGLSEGSEPVGHKIAQQLKPKVKDDALAIMTLADGLTFNFDRFRDALEQELGLAHSLPLFGGTAADNWEMKQTFQYVDDQLTNDGVACVLISGQAEMAWAVNHGCIPIGHERKVTKAEGNVIYEIDQQPVLDTLKEYLKEDEIDNWNKAVVNLCWGFKAPSKMQDSYDEYLIRFMPAKDDEKGSITIPTEVQEGASIWMTRRDQDKIAEGVDRIVEQIKGQLGERQPSLMFHFDCAGRGKMVFRDQERNKLMDHLQSQFDPSTPWVGFYTYGEIGPVKDSNQFHNYTLVLMALV
jgi:hypothetical protein